MHKKLAAALSIAIFVLSSVAIFTPAAAHFTLGDYTANFDYHARDFDPHLAGPTGYVWPGSGLASFTGTPGGAPPGYQSPWPNNNPPGQQQSVYQLEGNAYAPFGAILTSTEDHANRGPLVFAFNLTCAAGPNGPGFQPFCTERDLGLTTQKLNFTGVTIYIPPEFDLSSLLTADGTYNLGLIQTTFGANPMDLWLDKADMNDPIGPGWWVLSAYGDIHWWPEHDYSEWYYIRMNDVVAPTIAGKYFFKMFLWDMNSQGYWAQMNVPGAWDVLGTMTNPQPVGTTGCDGFGVLATCTGATARVPSRTRTFLTFPVENWPVLLVKGEVDPGIVYGTVRYGTFNQTLYGDPINLPGKIWMEGTAIDPYQPGQVSTGRPVWAMGYWNATAAGHYEVEGVAPGVYTIYAQAAGYPRFACAKDVVILSGQSFALDCYLNPGPVVHGQIFSKHLFGEEPWPVNPRPISVWLYSSNDYAQESMVAWSPWNKTHAPYMSYDWGLGYTRPEPLPVAYPWEAYGPTPFSYYNQFFPSPAANPALYVSHPAVTCGDNTLANNFVDLCGKPDGVGPAQYWWVDRGGVFTNGGGSNSFIFKFGVKGVFGAPTEIDGHVPQPYATWVNGLTAGRYFVRAFLNGYVQTLQDGVTLDESSFEVSEQEWAGDVFLPMDLRVSSVINKTIHFHDHPGTLDVCPINGCDGNAAQGDSRGRRYLVAEVRDSNGVLMGENFTFVFENQTHATIQINGFGMMGPDPASYFFDGLTTTPNAPCINAAAAGQEPCYLPAGPNGGTPHGMKFSLYRYQGYSEGPPDRGTHDYGLPSGTYVVRVYMRGYLQQTFESVSVTLSGAPAVISNHMYRGARFNITIYSIDWEHPRINRPWEFPSSRLRAYIYNDQGQAFSHAGTRWQPAYNIGTITGRCNLNAAENDHCHIVEWDGTKLFNVNAAGGQGSGGLHDTPPDWLTPNNNIAFYAPGGAPSAWLPYDGFLWFPTVYYRRGPSTNFVARNAFETGTYMFYGMTYGYVQHKQYSVYVLKGGFADIKINLLQGVNITINIPFKKEGIYSPTEFNMSMRVRIFDDEGRLIGSQSSQAADAFQYDTSQPLGIARGVQFARDPIAGIGGYYVDVFEPSPSQANGLTSVSGGTTNGDGFIWYGNYHGTGDAWQGFDSDVNKDGIPDFSTFTSQNAITTGHYKTWIPAGTKQVRVSNAGFYDYPNEPLGPFYAGVLGGRTLDDIRALQFMYGLPGSSSTIPEGIPVSYSGKYYVEVDTWNEYPTPSFNGGDFTPPFLDGPDARNWYPPVEGLLEGDSFHTIPGASPDVFGFTGNTLAANGLGPYAQRMVWEVPNGHLGSEVSVVYELDKRGYISGNIYGFTWSDELRTLSWTTVVALAADGTEFKTWSWDAHFDMYLDAAPGGTPYTLTIIAWTPDGQAYTVVSTPYTVSYGQSTTGIVFQLESSNIPIPEFSGLAIVFASALAASLYLLRRKRR